MEQNTSEVTPQSNLDSSDSAIGVAWYLPEEWETLRHAAVDRDILEETHAEWQKEAERVIRELRRHGLQVIKVNILVADLLLWCESQKIPLTAEARAQYTAFRVKQLSKK